MVSLPGHIPPEIALPKNPKILVITLRRLGDVLMSTPLIRSLKRAWPQASIDVLVFEGTAGILAGNPDIGRVIVMPLRPGAGATIKLLAQLWKRYSLAVSTQTGDRPTLFAMIAGRRHVGLTNPNGPRLGAVLKRLFLGRSIPVTENIHRVEQMLRLAEMLGIERVPELVCPAGAEPQGIERGERYAVIHAAPMFRYKEWTREGWRALAAGLAKRKLTVIAIGGPGADERDFLEQIWRGTLPIHQVKWPETVALLKRARIYVGPDTSVTHLAAAAGCPTVALFGPMDPRVWGPFPVGGLSEPWAASGTIQHRGNVWIVQNPLPCLPCAFEGCERRIDGPSICLDELMPEQVLAAVDRAMA